MMRFLATTLFLFAAALQFTSADTASHQQRDQMLRLGLGLITLQSATPVAPLRLQQLEKVLGQMPLGSRSFSE